MSRASKIKERKRKDLLKHRLWFSQSFDEQKSAALFRASWPPLCMLHNNHSLTSVWSVCQCWRRDPVFSVGLRRREAGGASQGSVSLSFCLITMNSISIILVIFYILITHLHILFDLAGDPQAADRPAVIAVFKTRTNPVFELLPWFVLLCAVAFHICGALKWYIWQVVLLHELYWVCKRFSVLVVLFKGRPALKPDSFSSVPTSSTELCSPW